jgi:hypothetical protein
MMKTLLTFLITFGTFNAFAGHPEIDQNVDDMQAWFKNADDASMEEVRNNSKYKCTEFEAFGKTIDHGTLVKMKFVPVGEYQIMDIKSGATYRNSLSRLFTAETIINAKENTSVGFKICLFCTSELKIKSPHSSFQIFRTIKSMEKGNLIMMSSIHIASLNDYITYLQNNGRKNLTESDFFTRTWLNYVPLTYSVCTPN